LPPALDGGNVLNTKLGFSQNLIKLFWLKPLIVFIVIHAKELKPIRIDVLYSLLFNCRLIP
jgi:hypothetical protein